MTDDDDDDDERTENAHEVITDGGVKISTNIPRMPPVKLGSSRPSVEVVVGKSMPIRPYMTQGASCNIMAPKALWAACRDGKVDGYLPPSYACMTTASGDSYACLGVYMVRTTVAGRPYTGPFLVPKQDGHENEGDHWDEGHQRPQSKT